MENMWNFVVSIVPTDKVGPNGATKITKFGSQTVFSINVLDSFENMFGNNTFHRGHWVINLPANKTILPAPLFSKATA